MFLSKDTAIGAGFGGVLASIASVTGTYFLTIGSGEPKASRLDFWSHEEDKRFIEFSEGKGGNLFTFENESNLTPEVVKNSEGKTSGASLTTKTGIKFSVEAKSWKTNNKPNITVKFDLTDDKSKEAENKLTSWECVITTKDGEKLSGAVKEEVKDEQQFKDFVKNLGLGELEDKKQVSLLEENKESIRKLVKSCFNAGGIFFSGTKNTSKQRIARMLYMDLENSKDKFKEEDFKKLFK